MLKVPLVGTILGTIRVLLILSTLPVTILTIGMSFDVSRITLDQNALFDSYTTRVDGSDTISQFTLEITNNGYLFTFSESNVTLSIFDPQSPDTPLGTATQSFDIHPGQRQEKQFEIRMDTERYLRTAMFNVTTTVDGQLALDYQGRTIPFVIFTMTSWNITRSQR